MQSLLFDVENFVTIGDSMGNLMECDNSKYTSFNILIRAYNNFNVELMLKVKWHWSNFEKKVSQPHFGLSVRVKPTFPKVGTWSPPGLPKIQKMIWGVKSPHISVLLVSLERSWCVDVQNGLALVIWTSTAQVMGKRRVRSQTGNLTPDH
jgi:hypothetical protein